MAEDDNQNNTTEEIDSTKTTTASETLFEIDGDDITIVELLQLGNHCNVYKGLYKKQPVAVKRPHGSAMVDDDLERFTRHVQILKRVNNHKDMLKFIGASVKDGCMQIVFEFLETYYNIQGVLANSYYPKTLSYVINIALGTSLVMEYLHSQGINHNSLYSSNLLVSSRGFKVTGFSQAVMEGVIDADSSKELRRKDVNDFGELLSEIVRGITSCVSFVDPSSQIIDKIPESLFELMNACMSMDPAKRPEFTLITQILESILMTINVAELGQHCGEALSNMPMNTLFEDMFTLMHDPEFPDDVFPKDVEQNTDELMEPTPSEAPSLMSLDEAVSPISQDEATTSLMAMEQTDGGTLEEYMLQLKPDVPSYTKTLKYALSISEAVRHLHAHGVSHGALKSSKILLTKDKDSLRLDGVEQASEEKTEEVDVGSFKDDVFSFSKILWELLTNNHTPFQVYAASMEEKRPRLDGVPNEMMQLLVWCAAKEAEERPDFAAIIETLEMLLDRMDRLAKVRAYCSTPVY